MIPPGLIAENTATNIRYRAGSKPSWWVRARGRGEIGGAFEEGAIQPLPDSLMCTSHDLLAALYPGSMEQRGALEAVRSPAHPASGINNLEHLGYGVWLRRGKPGPPTLLIEGSRHVRFLDYLYVPAATHRLSAQQILTINRFRNHTFNTDPQFVYNRRIRGLFSRIAAMAAGPTLEVGPSHYPLSIPGQEGLVLCDIDEHANIRNRERGYNAVTPSYLGRLANNSFNLSIASFVFHFGIGDTQAKDIARTISPDGIIIFNVLTKAASTRSYAVSQLSRFGLRFACINLEPIFGKEDVIFIGGKRHESLLFKAAYGLAAREVASDSN